MLRPTSILGNTSAHTLVPASKVRYFLKGAFSSQCTITLTAQSHSLTYSFTVNFMCRYLGGAHPCFQGVRSFSVLLYVVHVSLRVSAVFFGAISFAMVFPSHMFAFQICFVSLSLSFLLLYLFSLDLFVSCSYLRCQVRIHLIDFVFSFPLRFVV